MAVADETLPPPISDAAYRAYDERRAWGASETGALNAALLLVAQLVRAEERAKAVRLSREFGAVVMDSDGTSPFEAYL